MGFHRLLPRARSLRSFRYPEHPADRRSAARIADALDRDRMLLYSQPIVPLGGDASSPPTFELLLRLLDETGRIVLPGAFISSAERLGMIGAIDRWVVTEACASYRRCFAAIPDARVAINLSGRSVTDDAMLGFIEDRLAEHAVPPDRVIFEITETAAINDLDRAGRFMSALRARGCLFALDDVGTGAWSFAHLEHLPLDYLKIAGTLVRDMADDADDRALVAAIHRAGRARQLETVAEWAESRDLVDRLIDLGVDHAQGWALGGPVPIADSTAALPGAAPAAQLAC